jgi:hypothetical protein
MATVTRTRTPRFLALVVGVFASSTCDGPVEPTGPPGITIVAGADVADSIDARPAQALLVEVHTFRGLPARHALVQFSGLPTADVQNPSVRVAPISFQPILARTEDFTDASGRARVLLALGTVAGPGGVEITVPELGFADTAWYTINPGHGASLVSEPADTVVYQSRSFALRATVRDRYGNARSDPVSFVADSASASVSAAGTVTSEALGRARIRIGDGAGHADTTWVSVIPQGTIAATSPTGIVIVDLDGSNRRNVPGVAAAAWVDWSPAGDTLVFATSDYDSWLYVTNTTAPPRRLITDSTGRSSEWRPQYSRDGQWIYFSAAGNGRYQALWRVRPDGSSPEFIGPASGDNDGHVAPSSDGSRVAYVSNSCCYPNLGLFLLHLASGVADSLAPRAFSPRWSPGDSLIGFISRGVLVLRPDGQGLRQITPLGDTYYQGLDWSPAGDWMIGRRPSGHLVLIRVADRLIITLPYFTDLDRPAWRP